MANMQKPLIAVVGSIDQERDYDPPLKEPKEGKETAQTLGAALAERGYRLIVYTAATGFLEEYAVRGFIESGKATRKSIVAVFPYRNETTFAEYQGNEALFDFRRDRSSHWEVSYYRSLRDVQGVVLIGGGRSTFITGLIAVAHRIPLVAVQYYGGQAAEVWKALEPGKDLPTQEAINDMAKRGTRETLDKWIDSLEAQRKKMRSESSNAIWGLPGFALILLIGWVISLPAGYLMLQNKNPDSAEIGAPWGSVYVFMLFLAPLLAGGSGATIRTLSGESDERDATTLVRGIAAAAIASILYVLAQLLGGASPHTFALLGFSVAFGFIAGLTSDAVFERIKSINVLKPDDILNRKP